MTSPEIIAFAGRCARRIRVRPSWVDAEDCLHDCVVAYLSFVDKYPPECAVPRPVWLFRRIVSHVKSQYGRIRSTEGGPDPDTVASHDMDPDPKIDRQAAFDVVGFTPIERAVMVLRYDDGLNHADIASRLGVSRPYVTEVLTRAHDRCRFFYESDLRPDEVERLRQSGQPVGPRRKRGRPLGSRTRKGQPRDPGPPDAGAVEG